MERGGGWGVGGGVVTDTEISFHRGEVTFHCGQVFQQERSS